MGGAILPLVPVVCTGPVKYKGEKKLDVDIANVKSAGRDDPKNPKSAVVDVEFAGRLDPPTTLAEIKQSNLFGDWALVRQGRLSTMAAPEEFVAWMRKRYPIAKI